jgi:hypothetical protein
MDLGRSWPAFTLASNALMRLLNGRAESFGSGEGTGPEMMGAELWDDSLPEKAIAAVRGAPTRQVEAALRHATDFIESLPFKGRPARTGQRLAWPRAGVIGPDGAPVEGVPPEIGEATSLVAGFILARIAYDARAIGWLNVMLGDLVEDGADLAAGAGWLRT